MSAITLTQAQKDAWIAALRSGQYQQAKACLANDKGHCCLGVLAEAVCEIPLQYMRRKGYLDDMGLLILGPLEEAHGQDASIQRQLARMNDDGKSFVEIADYIEKNIIACDAQFQLQP